MTRAELINCLLKVSMTRAELITALESDSQPNKVLDFWCWWYGRSTEADKPDPKPPPADYVRDKLGYPWTFRPTASVDDALTLVPKGWRIYAMQEEYIGPRGPWFASLDHHTQHYQLGSKIGKAPTPALALCIAALRARAD